MPAAYLFCYLQYRNKLVEPFIVYFVSYFVSAIVYTTFITIQLIKTRNKKFCQFFCATDLGYPGGRIRWWTTSIITLGTDTSTPTATRAPALGPAARQLPLVLDSSIQSV